MGGIAMVLNTAKQALAAQQLGLNVTGQNISNVNTPGFSRQTAVMDAQRPMNIGGLNLGTGVTVDDITRASDQLLENRLSAQKSTLASYQEAQSYMQVLETQFNETSGDGLSSQISAFWSAWQDLSNNPTGAAERTSLFGTGDQLSQMFNSLSANIQQQSLNTNKEMDSAVSQINTLTAQIADSNEEIVANSGNSSPNDLLDTRNNLVQKLANLIDIKTFEQPNGSISVVTGSGHTLVYKNDTYALSSSDGRIYWEGSDNTQVDITDKISGGQIAGWLTMRDEVFPKYQNDLDTLAREFIWSTNLQQSQGVGTELFKTPVTGTYGTDDSHMLSTLDFGNRIDYTGGFKMWVHDANTYPPTAKSIKVDMGVSSATPTYGAGAFAGHDAAYDVQVVNGGTVGTDTIDLKWRVNGGSWTTTSMAGNSVTIDGQTLNFTNGDKLDSGNMVTVHSDASGTPIPLSLGVTGTANSLLDTYTFNVTSGGTSAVPRTLTWHNGNSEGTINLDAGVSTATVDGMTLDFGATSTLVTGDEFTISTDNTGTGTFAPASDWHWTLDSFADAFNNAADQVAGGVAGSGYVQASVNADNTLTFTPKSTDYSFGFSDDGSGTDAFSDAGLTAALGINSFFDGNNALGMKMNSVLNDKNLIAAGQINGDSGDFGVGDSRNALAIAGLQNQTGDMVQWTFERGKDPYSSLVTTTMEGYYQGMIGSMGVKAASINRNADFSKTLANQIEQQRDSISGVNLDEEMVNLMKYQHAYAAASKLLTTADDMLTTLINSK
jgi:flagellar hook-associated protein FlgK